MRPISSRLAALLGAVGVMISGAQPVAPLLRDVHGIRLFPPVSPDVKRRERLSRAKQYQPNGERECARRRRRMATGVLQC